MTDHSEGSLIQHNAAERREGNKNRSEINSLMVQSKMLEFCVMNSQHVCRGYALPSAILYHIKQFCYSLLFEEMHQRHQGIMNVTTLFCAQSHFIKFYQDITRLTCLAMCCCHCEVSASCRSPFCFCHPMDSTG